MRVIELHLRGHLTDEVLRAALLETQPSLDLHDDRVLLLIDCREMTDYALAARSAFVAWNKANKARIEKVAIVTAKPLWQMVVSAMALASGQTMQAFSTVDAATTWLTGG